MHCAVLGNGPSKHRYDYSAEYVIGCNIPTDEIKVDATVISDVEIVWLLQANPELVNVPMVVSDKVYEKLKELKLVDNYKILLVFKTHDWHNSAHYATQYLIEKKEATVIDVWGCDSVFIKDPDDDLIQIASSTDDYVDKSTSENTSKLIKNWNLIWVSLLESYQDIKFRFMIL